MAIQSTEEEIGIINALNYNMKTNNFEEVVNILVRNQHLYKFGASVRKIPRR